MSPRRRWGLRARAWHLAPVLLWLGALAGCAPPGGDLGGADAAPGGADLATSDLGGASPTCLGRAAGSYCGSDQMANADPDTLYQCPGPGQPPTSSMRCAEGCLVMPAGTPDACKVAGTPGSYKLPWHGISMQLTQDCNVADHTGTDKYAWDFANGGSYTIVAARGGTITHLKIASTTGCGSSGCVNDANYLVIDHGDGTQSTYLHLEGRSLAPGITCGATVQQGQALAMSGTTGWSTGIHLHFQVSGAHAGAATCECGSDGLGCAANQVSWNLFWVTTGQPALPISFVEWPAASQCGGRVMPMPASQN